MAEELRLNIVSTADSKGLTKAARDMGAAEDAANKLGKSFAQFYDNSEQVEQSLESTTKGVRDHTEQIKILRAEYEKTTKKIADLDAQLLGGGDSKSIRKDLREQRAFLAELQRVAKEVKRDSGIKFSLGGGDGGGRLPSPGGMGAIAGMPAPVVAGLVAAVSAAGPAIGAIIGGAVAGATGTAAMALGIATAAKDARVRAAASKFGQDITAEFFQGDAFVEPVIEGLAILKDAFLELDLDEGLAKVAPTVTVIARGIANFAKNLDAGLDKTLDRMGPAADAAAQGIGELGDAIGDMVDMISSSDGAVDGIRLTFAALGGTLRFIGAEIKFLEDRWHEIINVIGMFSSMGAHTGFATFDQGIRQLTGHSGELNAQITFMGSASGQAAQKAYELANGLGEVETETFSAIDALKQYDDMLAGRANGQIAFEQSLDDLAAGFKEFGRNLNIDTQNGRENMKNFEDAIGDAKKVRDELLAQGKIEEANAAYQKMVARIREVMTQAHLTKAEIDKLLGPHELVIGITYKQNNRPPLYVASGMSQGALDAAGAGRRASGGPVFPFRDYLVGEEGPELLRMGGQGGFVYPNRSSSGGGGGGMANARPLNINFPAGSYEAHLIETISTAVQARGGRLAVLGLKAA